MFSFEIRINSDLIAHIYGHNEGISKSKDGRRLRDYYNYSYRYYKCEDGKIINGNVRHKRSEQINKLITVILKDVEKQNKKNYDTQKQITSREVR